MLRAILIVLSMGLIVAASQLQANPLLTTYLLYDGLDVGNDCEQRRKKATTHPTPVIGAIQHIRTACRVYQQSFAIWELKKLLKTDAVKSIDQQVCLGTMGCGTTALMLATYYGYPKAVEALTDAGADVDIKNEKGQTALSYAKHYATPNPSNYYEHQWANIATHLQHAGPAIIRATKNGHLTSVQHMLGKGTIDVDTRDRFGDRMTALEHAIANEHFEIAKLLIDAGDINTQNNAGDTALMIAAKHDDQEAVEFLIGARADVNIQNNNGKRALDYAIDNEHFEIAQLLIDSGAEHSEEQRAAVNRALEGLSDKFDRWFQATQPAANKAASALDALAEWLGFATD